MTDANLLTAIAAMIVGAFAAWRLLPRALRGTTATMPANSSASSPALQA